jgi:serine protease Do
MRWGGLVGSVAGVSLLAAGVACGSGGTGAATLRPGDLFETAKPAVVILETDNAVTWSVPEPALTAQKAQQLHTAVQAQVRSGQVASTESAMGQASARLLSDNPGNWLSAGTQRHQQTDSVLALGTGFFVTQDGYLLTSDHVVHTPSDEVQRQLLGALEGQSGEPTYHAGFRDEISRALASPFTDVQAGKVYQWMMGVFMADLRVVSVSPRYRIGFGSASPSVVQSAGVEVRLVGNGDVATGRDVALLKAGGGPYVSLPLVSSAPPSGAALAVIGYPCGCDASRAVDPTRILRPALTSGTSREALPMPGGWSALATDAAVEHGSSGGPVLDDHGRVVGVATFADSPAAGAPHSFAIPASVAARVTDEARVRPGQGSLARAYAQAVADYRQDQFRAALPLFQQVAATERHDDYASQYVARSEAAIAAGRDRTPALTGPLPAIVVSLYVAVTVAAAALGVVAYRRRRRLLQSW